MDINKISPTIQEQSRIACLNSPLATLGFAESKGQGKKIPRKSCLCSRI